MARQNLRASLVRTANAGKPFVLRHTHAQHFLVYLREDGKWTTVQTEARAFETRQAAYAEARALNLDSRNFSSVRRSY